MDPIKALELLKSEVGVTQGVEKTLYCVHGMKVTPRTTSSLLEHPGYGKCADCSCPGFTGSGYTCTRGGCGHHYDRHW